MSLRAVLAATALLSGLRTVGAEPCPPRASLAGDDAAIARVTAELVRLGVTVTNETTTAGACTVVRARVELADASGGIAVAVHGASRGSEGRVVSDAALAAAWIDSWTRQDVDTALWAAPPRVAAAMTTTLAPPSTAPVDAPPAIARSGWERFAVSASYAQSWSDDDASWTGLDVTGCVAVGGFCVGGSVRAMFDGERIYNATGVARSDVSVLAIGRYPIAIGRMSIAPELGVGVGRLGTRRAESACKLMPPPNCDPMTDPMCAPEAGACDPSDPGTMTPKYVVGDGFDAATFAPRIALAVRVAVPLFEHVWLDALAGFALSPFAHADTFEADLDPTAMIPSEAVALPGEPSSGYGIGIGLRVGSK